MRELDNAGNPIKASTYNWQARGYDGFLGYGYDEATGECCEDCICDDTCTKPAPTTFEIRVYWLEDCTDLDMQAKLYDKSGGWSCANNSLNNGQYSFECLNPRLGNFQDVAGHQICWAGDNTDSGGYEIFHIILDWERFEQDKVEHLDDEYFKLELFAHWHEPEMSQECSGTFDFYVLPCGHPPYSNCNAEGDINTPFIQKRISNYKKTFSGCSKDKIVTLYINREAILDSWESGVNEADFDPRGKGVWYSFV